MTDPSREPSGHPVGEGPDYEAIRAEARKLLPLFTVSGGPGGSWGAGLIEILEPVEDGHRAAVVYPAASQWQQNRNSLERVVDLGQLRATGIALLAYCEAQEADGA